MESEKVEIDLPCCADTWDISGIDQFVTCGKCYTDWTKEPIDSPEK